MAKKKSEIVLSNIGFNIKERRESKGLSQAKVALHCGVSLAAFQRWENGLTKFIKKDNLDKLTEILGQ